MLLLLMNILDAVLWTLFNRSTFETRPSVDLMLGTPSVAALTPAGRPLQVGELRGARRMLKRITYRARLVGRGRFGVRVEGRLERTLKRLGLAMELQVGDATFDRTLFVIGHHPAVRTLVAERADVRDALMALVSSGGGDRKLWWDGEHLVLQSTGDPEPAPGWAAAFDVLCDAIDATPALRERPTRVAPALWAVYGFEAFSVALVFYALWNVIAAVVDSPQRTLTSTPTLLFAGLATGLVLGLLFVIAATLVLRRTSFTAALLGDVAAGLVFGFLVGGPALFSDLNAGLDSGPAFQVTVDVVHTGIGGLGRSVDDPGPPFARQAVALLSPAEVEAFGRPVTLRSIRIPRRLLHGGGKRWVLTLRPGAFGVPWLESIDDVDAPGTPASP